MVVEISCWAENTECFMCSLGGQQQKRKADPVGLKPAALLLYHTNYNEPAFAEARAGSLLK